MHKFSALNTLQVFAFAMMAFIVQAIFDPNWTDPLSNTALTKFILPGETSCCIEECAEYGQLFLDEFAESEDVEFHHTNKRELIIQHYSSFLSISFEFIRFIVHKICWLACRVLSFYRANAP